MVATVYLGLSLTISNEVRQKILQMKRRGTRRQKHEQKGGRAGQKRFLKPIKKISIYFNRKGYRQTKRHGKSKSLFEQLFGL